MGCNHLLYPGDRYPYLIPEQIKPIPQELKVELPIKNEFLHAWYWPAQSSKTKGIVVHYHGNGQNLTTHFLFFKWMTEFGYDYLVFDYRGYGASSGEKASQEKTVEDGIAVLEYVAKSYPGRPVIAVGQSLGSAVLARSLQEIQARGQKELLPKVAVFDSSFISYQAATRSVLKQRWFLYPVIPISYFLISDEWSPANRLQDQPDMPALFFHNTGDLIIRSELGEDAFKNWKGPKLFIKDENGSHTSAFGDPKFQHRKKQLIDCIDLIVVQSQNISNCQY